MWSNAKKNANVICKGTLTLNFLRKLCSKLLEIFWHSGLKSCPNTKEKKLPCSNCLWFFFSLLGRVVPRCVESTWYLRSIAIPSNIWSAFWNSNSNKPGPFLNKVPLNQLGIFPEDLAGTGFVISFTVLKSIDCSLRCSPCALNFWVVRKITWLNLLQMDKFYHKLMTF